MVLVYKGAKDKHIPTGGGRWKEGMGWDGKGVGGVRFRLERGESTRREIVLAQQGDHKQHRFVGPRHVSEINQTASGTASAV